MGEASETSYMKRRGREMLGAFERRAVGAYPTTTRQSPVQSRGRAAALGAAMWWILAPTISSGQGRGPEFDLLSLLPSLLWT